MQKIANQLKLLESFFHQYNIENQRISSANVGWHIEHSLLTIRVIVNALHRSDPCKYKQSFSLSKLLVFTFNLIPRGRAKAPEIILPSDNSTELTLHQSLEDTLAVIGQIETMDANAYIRHPYFGQLNKKATIRFLAIHTGHHIKIIKDIIAANR